MSAGDRDVETKLGRLHRSCVKLAERLAPDGHSFVVQIWEGSDAWYASVAYRDSNAWQEGVGEGEGISILRALEQLEGSLEDALIERRDELAS